MVGHYWDYLSQKPEDYFTYQHGKEIVRQLVPWLKRDGDLLDYGCGPGFLLEQFISAGYCATGLDSSGATRAAVAERLGKMNGFNGVYDLPGLLQARRRFETITCVEVVEHLYDEQLDEIIAAMKSLLNPGGTIIFTTPNEEKLSDSYLLCPVSKQLYHRWQHVRSWSAQSLTAALEQRGLKVDTRFTTDFANGLCRKHDEGGRKYWRRQCKRAIRDITRTRRKKPHLVAVARNG